MSNGRFVPRHGHCTAKRGHRTPTYITWNGMIQRCTNPASSAYGSYGARGITVCGRWLKFDNFLADMGERPRGTSIDRIDVNGHYEPSNCRWATAAEQRANQRKGLIDLAGLRFSRLVVLEFAGRNRQRNSLWRCVCDCGGVTVLPEYRLKNGTTHSCGCLARELSAIRASKLSSMRWRRVRNGTGDASRHSCADIRLVVEKAEGRE